MTASTELLIGDADGQHVLVRAEARHHPHLFDSSAGNWISSEVDIAAGGMRATFRAELKSEEFQAFLDEVDALTRTLAGVATFSTTEGQLTVSLTGDPSGQVRVAGEAVDAPGSGNRLYFGFEVDQRRLPQISQSLQLLLSAFPVVGVADA